MWEGTDVLKHLMPLVDILSAAAKFADSISEMRIVLDGLARNSIRSGELKVPAPGYPPWHDASGAFSDMNFVARNMTDGWHLDYALAASLVRLWSPSEGSTEDGSGCHTTIADFGAGGGRYCKLFNRTGEYCCQAFDGSSRAAFHTGGAVQTQRLDEAFDFGRQFDWLMCLEVVEHIPGAFEHIALANLRRHARKGIVLSWSQEDGEIHPNAKSWPEARKSVEAAGFTLDEAASTSLRTKVSWLEGAVHVFRVTT
eukprot:TRINITY_DN15533_c0_g1_i1.p1 TRINITY_DN15533_c0_g1~~TRINITY_DN15533_c0_g1_i1.p1  ORF type:complete len:255 (-),score=49.21 TRINITY_DN15533_c0_g1_i1:129-893(-)